MAKKFKTRVSISDFYDAIQELFGSDPIHLIGEWTQQNVDLVTSKMQAAIQHCGIIGTTLPNFAFGANNKARSNQSK
jgi:hypothetical protein